MAASGRALPPLGHWGHNGYGCITLVPTARIARTVGATAVTARIVVLRGSFLHGQRPNTSFVNDFFRSIVRRNTVISRLSHGYLTVISRLYHGYLTVISRLYHGDVTVISRLCRQKKNKHMHRAGRWARTLVLFDTHILSDQIARKVCSEEKLSNSLLSFFKTKKKQTQALSSKKHINRLKHVAIPKGKQAKQKINLCHIAR